MLVLCPYIFNASIITVLARSCVTLPFIPITHLPLLARTRRCGLDWRQNYICEKVFLLPECAKIRDLAIEFGSFLFRSRSGSQTEEPSCIWVPAVFALQAAGPVVGAATLTGFGCQVHTRMDISLRHSPSASAHQHISTIASFLFSSIMLSRNNRTRLLVMLCCFLILLQRTSMSFFQVRNIFAKSRIFANLLVYLVVVGLASRSNCYDESRHGKCWLDP